MSQAKTVRELQFQNDIIDQMLAQGWLLGESNKYNKELAVAFGRDVATMIKTETK